MNGNFGVLTDGTTYMTNAHVKGDIYADSGTFNGTVYASNGSFNGTVTATSGEIGGCVIDNGTLKIKDANIDTLTINKVTSGTNNASMTFNGSITCNNLTAKSKGTIAGWKITPNSLKDANELSTLRDDGYVVFYPYNNGKYEFSNFLNLQAQPGTAVLINNSTRVESLESGTFKLLSKATMNIEAGTTMRISAPTGIRLRATAISVGDDDDHA